jgi:hypothetical protein
MHRKKEEVILRILAQESLDLELWLKRYEFLKFWSYFCGFSEAMDLFVNIFQILGPNCKILNYGLILKKPRGLSAKCPTYPEIRIIFQRIMSWTGSTRGEPGRARVIHRGPTAARTEGVGARWRAHRSMTSGRSGALKLTGEGAIVRGEHEELDWGLTGARAAAW